MIIAKTYTKTPSGIEKNMNFNNRNICLISKVNFYICNVNLVLGSVYNFLYFVNIVEDNKSWFCNKVYCIKHYKLITR